MFRKIITKFDHYVLGTILFLFPLSVLLRSTTINLYFVFLSLVFLIKFKEKKKLLQTWHYIFFIYVVYLCLNSYFAIDNLSSLKNGFSQLRFVFFVLFLTSVTLNFKSIKFAMNMSSFLITFICFDVFFQYFFGYDLFGIEADPINNLGRLSGPFGKELIVGSYIFLISVPIISFFFHSYKSISNIQKIYSIFFLIITFLTVLFTGERMSFLLFCMAIGLILILNLDYKKVIFFSATFLLVTILIMDQNSYVNVRFQSFKANVVDFKNSSYFKLFRSGIVTWKENPLTGVGLKNFRIKCGSKKFNTRDINKIKKIEDTKKIIQDKKLLCSTHPHNLYIEILAESGIIGIFLFFLIFYCIFSQIIRNYNLIENKYKGLFCGSLIVILTYIWPIKSSGSIYSTFYASFLWYNVGIVFCIIRNSIKLKEK